MNRDRLIADLEAAEGRRKFPYVDTVGKTSIGVGWNLTDNGLPDSMIDALRDNAIAQAEIDLTHNCPWWLGMSDPAQRALAEMCFILGITRLLRFKKMLGFLKSGDYAFAADEALASQWAGQVGPTRSKRIADQIRGE